MALHPAEDIQDQPADQGIGEHPNHGATFIDQVKNLLISYVAARMVVEGQLTLGEMVSIQYILGQLNAPLKRIAAMIHEIQDVKISMERLGDIYNREDEDPVSASLIKKAPYGADIVLKNVSFHCEEGCGSEEDSCVNLIFQS